MLKVVGGWVWVVYNKFWGSFNAGTLSFSHAEGGGGGTTGFGVVSMQALEVLDMLKGGRCNRFPLCKRGYRKCAHVVNDWSLR